MTHRTLLRCKNCPWRIRTGTADPPARPGQRPDRWATGDVNPQGGLGWGKNTPTMAYVFLGQAIRDADKNGKVRTILSRVDSSEPTRSRFLG